MLTTIQTRLKRASRWLPALLLPFAAQAQAPGYSLGNTANVAGTFTSIATTGTAIATANTDDANSGATPIGFTFNYNGTAFTDFVLNTNGFIRLGTAAPSSAALFYTAPQAATAGPIASTNPADVNLIMPFAVDLTAGSVAGTGYQVATTGAAGSRVTTIQWTNVQDKASTIATQLLNFSFQVKLYESGQIEFVYGPTVANTVGNNFRTVAVGIKGSSAAASTTITKGSTQAWSGATFAAGDYTGNTHNIRQAATADAGRTYRFGPNLANDAAVAGLFTLGKVSSAYSSPVTAQVVVANPGNAAQTNLLVTFTVTGATTFSTTQTVAALASGASTTLTFSYPVTGTTGTNVVTASIPNTDDLATNNSKTYSQGVTAASLSFIDSSQPLFTAGVGVGAVDGVLAARYTLTQAATVSSVSATFVGAGNANTTYQVQLYNAGGTGGTPGTVLYTSPTQTRPVVSGTVVIPVPSISLPAGDFFVAIKELDNNVVLAYQVEDPLRPATFYFQVPGSPFALVNTTALRTRLALEVGLGAPSPCGTVTALAVGSITATGASISFTAPASGTSYTVTYTPAGGTATTVTPAPTASPVVLTGLTPGTSYTVSVITNCAAGLTAGPATTTFATPVAPPAYAPLPYVQDFETTWLSVGGTRDAPAANWRNSPVTGDNSWRRDDDGVSANWRFLLDDNDPTLNVYNTRFSTGARSARFHSYGSAAGLVGRLDMYVNMSAVGNKTLSFDYINSTGADKLDVFVSTDGGSTFGATPVLTATVNTTFTAKTVAINSSSATTVIRFQATSDFGNNDLGIDNVQLRLISATQNAALAATVGLYPNPAHQSFQLSVPAGSLRTASATLINALGQVVQSRQLNLPVAGGNTTFDVSSLAAGVYSLQLKSGNDLVVKRVVVE